MEESEKKEFRLFDEGWESDLNSDFGNWEVKDDGTLLYHGTEVKCFKEVDGSKLSCIDPIHVMSRVWTDYKDALNFFYAYLQASKNAGYQTLTINLKDHCSTTLK